MPFCGSWPGIRLGDKEMAISAKDSITSIAQLAERVTRPSEFDVAFMRALKGDIVILGAGGKIGPSLAMLARRAADQAGMQTRITAVSRFTSEDVRLALETAGVKTISCDLLNPAAVAQLPACENVLYLAGRKFGSSGRPDLTWAMNAIAPALAAHQYRGSRIVIFSTGNVYGMRDTRLGGSKETGIVAPTGEYAQSCLARERIFEYYSNEHKTPCLIFRLNYAVDLRYGVLVDIARRVYSGEAIDLTVPEFNVIWQGDSNSYALRSLNLCASPPRILNVTGREILRVQNVAEEFAKRFGRTIKFEGQYGNSALLSDASLCFSLLCEPSVRDSMLIDWVADWILAGGENLDKPTHFEVVDGSY
jgi:nucleoside-diphosphate-sugar epimerase